MQEVSTNLLENVWTYTIVGGIIATVVGGYLLMKFFGSKDTGTDGIQINNTINNQLPTGFNITRSMDALTGDTTKIVGYKKTARILFIDNESLRDKIRGIKNAGWENVTQIRDVENIDSLEIRNADVIFVDYKGIGS